MIGAAELQNLANTYNRVYLENQETQKLICHQAEHDALTEALNRGSYEKLLHIYETGDALFALILIDVDIFKSVNDIYGHAVGDAILQKVTGSLKKAFRSIDYVCRIGGDEFMVLIRNINNGSIAENRVKKLIDEVRSLEIPEMDGNGITISVGLAFSPEHGTTFMELYRHADTALYQVKQGGRNGFSVYEKAN